MSDLIDRQAAIDVLARTARENFSLSDEFDHYIAGLIDGDTAIRQLPSAQPEIVRCKDCKWYGRIGCAISIVDDSDKPTENDFCSFAERRTDD